MQIQNETLLTISKRRSVRTFLKDDIPDEIIQVLLKAANDAPSAHNQQSWRFVVLKGDKKQGLANLVNTKANDFDRPASALLRMASKSITSAPVVIAVFNTGDLIRHGSMLFKVDKEVANDFFRVMEIQSSSAAVQNILLSATSLGLGSVWLGILYLIKNEVTEYLQEPQGDFMAVVPIGYPAKDITSGPQKQPLEYKVKYLS